MSKAIVDYIVNEFNERKERNKSYSVRAFANSIGIEHSNLSKIMNQKRPLTFETANRILSALRLQTSTKNTLLLSLSSESNYTEPLKENEFVTLDESEIQETYNWYFFGILSALEIPEVGRSVLSVSQFLGLEETVVLEAVKVLVKLGAVDIVEGRLVLSGKQFTTPKKKESTIESEALKRVHIDHMNKAIEFIESNDRHNDFSGFTCAVPAAKLNETSRRIKEFRRSLGTWLIEGDGNKDDVYRMNIQFFPLSASQDKRMNE